MFRFCADDLRLVIGLLAFRTLNNLLAFRPVIVLAFFGAFATSSTFACAIVWLHTITPIDVFHDGI